jgi:hypothetical protein
MTAAFHASDAAQITLPPQDTDCWVIGTQAGDLSIQCQPLAARGNDIMWPATIRGISAERVALVFQRRFEPQTSLSLSLPETGSDSTTCVFARVTRVEPLGDGRWLLDCTFVSPLTEERLGAILRASKKSSPAQPAPSAASLPSDIIIEKVIVTGVLFQVRYGNRDPIRRPVTRLHVNGGWPLTAGRAMKVWVGGGPMNESAADVRVNGCYKQGGSFLIDCYFLGAPPPILLEKLRKGIM